MSGIIPPDLLAARTKGEAGDPAGALLDLFLRYPRCLAAASAGLLYEIPLAEAEGSASKPDLYALLLARTELALLRLRASDRGAP